MFPQELSSDLIQWAIEWGVKYVVENSPRWVREIRRHWPSDWQADYAVAHPGLRVHRTGLVNRERECRAIRDAILDAQHSRLLFFFGPRGVGKTRLLEETRLIVKSLPMHLDLRWGGIIDLYHVDQHSIPALQYAIVSALDPQGRFFAGFREALKKFKQHQEQGFYEELKTDRSRLQAAFDEEYRSFTREFRPIIAFDTLERIHDDVDLFHQLTGRESASVSRWLFNFCLTAPNSVFLFAGRFPLLEMAVSSLPGQNRLEAIPVDGFVRPDAFALLTSFLKKQPALRRALLQDPVREQLWRLTNGRPVELALAVELISRGSILASQINPGEQEQINPKTLVSLFFERENPVGKPVFFLGLARKGLTADLLHYLEPSWSLEECRQKLDALRRLSVVKTRPGREELFLHDALYDLFDRYVAQENDLKFWYSCFLEYYQERQATCIARRQEWEEAILNLLYYALQLDAWQAFQTQYLRQSERAIAGYEIELDMRLRDELFWYLQSSSDRSALQSSDFAESVNLDSAVRWVKRYIFQGAHQRAASLAATILSLGPAPYRQLVFQSSTPLTEIPSEVCEQVKSLLKKADRFFWGHLLTYYGDALLYVTGVPEKEISLALSKAQEFLQTSNTPENLDWLRSRLLGRVYDRLGYLARTYGHYDLAVQNYRQAIPYYEKADVKEELATTLNNQAFVLGLLGRIQEAMECADKAFAYRQELGQRYTLALSRNTRGLIYALFDFEKGRRECQLALNAFEELEAPRGIGLARNALGYILRKQGSKNASIRNFAAAEQFFQQSEEFLKRSADIFQEKVTEPIRLWEAYNELGSLYFDWGNYLLTIGKQQEAESKLQNAVEKHQAALDVAQRSMLLTQKADSADDIAKAYIAMRKPKKAKIWLNEARRLIPNDYDLTKRRQGPRPPAGELYWLAIGKFWLQSGDWALYFSQTNQGEKTQIALRNFLLAVVSTAAYSKEYAALHWPEIASRLTSFDIKEVQRAYKELEATLDIRVELPGIVLSYLDPAETN